MTINEYFLKLKLSDTNMISVFHVAFKALWFKSLDGTAEEMTKLGDDMLKWCEYRLTPNEQVYLNAYFKEGGE